MSLKDIFTYISVKTELLFCVKYYRDFFPIEDVRGICDKMNAATLDSDTEIDDLLNFLLECIKSEIANSKLNIEEAERGRKNCYRRKKERDEEGNKTGKKTESLKWSRKRDNEFFSEKSKIYSEQEKSFKELQEHIINSEITEDDFELINIILYENRLNLSFEIGLIIAVITFLAIIVIKNVFFH